MKNRHNLSRYISSQVRFAIRKRCGFGCVICGNPIIEYHHFDPEFSEATIHDEKGITILCGRHHTEATKKILDPLLIMKANSNPYSIQNGKVESMFYTGDFLMPVILGSAKFNSWNILMYDSHLVLGILGPETPGGCVRLNAFLTDSNGVELLKIVNNEWFAGIDRYDIENPSKERFLIRSNKGEIILELKLGAYNQVEIVRLEMMYRGFTLSADKETFKVRVPSGATFIHRGENTSEIGVWLNSSGYALIGANSFGGAAVRIG